jgi:hypothetical protein
MTSKEKVKMLYPEAIYAMGSERVYSSADRYGFRLSGEFADERHAWADAWRRIRPQHEPKRKEG